MAANKIPYGNVDPEKMIDMISLAHGLELDFGNDLKAMRRYRARIYALNKLYAGQWRFRTMREDSSLIIWRLAQ